MSKPVTPELRQRIVALYQSGISQEKVAAEVGYSYPTINKVLQQEGASRALSDAHRLRWKRDRLFTDEEAMTIRRRHEQDMVTIQELADEHNVSRTPIVDAIIRVGGKPRNCAEAGVVTVGLSGEQIAEMVCLYRDGTSAKQLMKRFGVNEYVVRTRTAEAGVRWRPYDEVGRNQLPYGNVFENAERSEVAAYWIGFLMADGYVLYSSSGQKSVGLGLSGDDGSHVLRLQEFIGLPGSVRKRPAKWKQANGKWHWQAESTCYQVGCGELVTALEGYGVTRRKSHTCVAHESLAMNRHFWRGYFDGDGHLRLDRTSGAPVVQLVSGSHLLLEQFVDFIKPVSGFRCSICPTNGIWSVRTTSFRALKIVAEMYRGATVALPRKAKIAAVMVAQL